MKKLTLRDQKGKFMKGHDGFPNKTSFKKGQKAWNKGILCKEETKEKLKKWNLGKKHSLETKLKLSKMYILKGQDLVIPKSILDHILRL